MSYDIYGNNLRKGYCEVHPHVNQEYPCQLCYEQYGKMQQDPFHVLHNNYFENQNEMLEILKEMQSYLLSFEPIWLEGEKILHHKIELAIKNLK